MQAYLGSHRLGASQDCNAWLRRRGANWAVQDPGCSHVAGLHPICGFVLSSAGRHLQHGQ